MAKKSGSGQPGTMSYRGTSSGNTGYGMTVQGQLTPAQWAALRRATAAAAVANRLRKGKKALQPTALEQARAQGYKR